MIEGLDVVSSQWYTVFDCLVESPDDGFSTHSQWAVLVTLLVERDAAQRGEKIQDKCFEIEKIEQIKGIPRGRSKHGMLGFFDMLRVPIIENTAHEEDLTSSLEVAMDRYPDTYAVLVRRHGVYVWGDDVQKAKTQAER